MASGGNKKADPVARVGLSCLCCVVFVADFVVVLVVVQDAVRVAIYVVYVLLSESLIREIQIQNLFSDVASLSRIIVDEPATL